MLLYKCMFTVNPIIYHNVALYVCVHCQSNNLSYVALYVCVGFQSNNLSYVALYMCVHSQIRIV